MMVSFFDALSWFVLLLNSTALLILIFLIFGGENILEAEK